MPDQIYVIKRDGRKEPLQIAKIQKYTHTATDGVEGVSQSELEVDAKLHFRDGMLTSDIQTTLIKTAVDKIDIDTPNWTFVAARLFLYDLYHKTNNCTRPKHLREYFAEGVQAGRIHPTYWKRYDLDALDAYIDHSRDMQFTYLGIKTFYDRYILKDREGNPLETPQQVFMAVAMFLAQNECNPMEWAKKFYDILSKFEVMAATPTLSNARTERHQLSSCYIGSTPDNIEGIFDSYHEMALLSKFGGGIGWDWCDVRGMGSYIDNNAKAAGGIVPFLKINNDVAIAVDQLGTRKGAIAVYVEPWHIDVTRFIDLKKNSGEERHRAHDLFPAMWLNDIFMERVNADANWTLFDPYEVPHLHTLYGEEFEAEYRRLENDASVHKEVIKAKVLWKEILRSYFETGSPFLTFKDTANRANPNKHTGVIRSTNLCTEIFQNTAPDTYKCVIKMVDGTTFELDENDIVAVEGGIKKRAAKVTTIDTIHGVKVLDTYKKRIDGDTAVCNLASVNLSKVDTAQHMGKVVPIAIRMLDNVIDLNFYPLPKVRKTNMKTRAIGLGVMGEAEYLAVNKIEWGSEKHLAILDSIMESFSYNAIESSMELAIEKGTYPTFEGSDWSKGILPIDKANENAKALTTRGHMFDWDGLRERVKQHGMRNGYLMAIAPTSSISILVGTTQAIEPIYKKKWFEENLSGLIPNVVPKLSLDTWAYYPSAYDIDQVKLIKAGAIRQKWLDQGQSLNVFITLEGVSGKTLNEIYMTAWRYGLKSTYYLRSQSPEAVKSDQGVEDRSQECHGCQ